MVKATSVRPGHMESTGDAGHVGGVTATERLLVMVGISPGQQVLELGCGTGRTAALMAGKGTEVVAVDIDARMLGQARARAAERGVGEKISFIQADAHRLPFREGTFDAAVAESVLGYCDAGKVCRETYRVIRPGGAFGANELTYMRSPDPVLKAMLRLALGLAPQLTMEWLATLKRAGFTDITSRTTDIRLTEQLLKLMKVGSLGRQRAATASLSAMSKLKAAMTLVKYRSFVGYGLYTGKKPETTESSKQPESQ